MKSRKIKRKATLVHAICKNCETQLHGRYCHVCGQDVFTGAVRTVKDLIFNAMENMFVLDNKLLITFKYLLFFPGKLSIEYRNGRIKSYVHPSKLFWFISILFFTILTIQIKNAIAENNKPKTEMTKLLIPEVTKTDEVNIKNKTETTALDIEKTVKEAIKEKKNSSEVNTNIEDNDEVWNNKEMQSEIISIFSTFAPYVSFILIPFFALLLALFFRKRDYFYADHLAFALHFHSFIFILFGLYIGIISAFPDFDHPKTTFLILPTIYLIIALYVFYRPKKFTLIPKIIGISIIYFITAFIILITFVVLLAANSGLMDSSDF